jgi:hypothetical protein
MSGHHAAYTLVIGDEASAIDDRVYQGVQGFAKRRLWIGNAWDSDGFFRRGCDAGDLRAA